MVSGNERVNEGRSAERRRRRSGCLADALRLQLEACREDEGLSAIVVSDELGLCVAHAGGDGGHDELAARLPMLADATNSGQNGDGDGDREGADQPPRASLALATFSIAGATLHACAVKNAAATMDSRADGDDAAAAVLARVAGGFTRLLAR